MILILTVSIDTEPTPDKPLKKEEISKEKTIEKEDEESKGIYKFEVFLQDTYIEI